jgi:hypothetical protein
MGIDINEVPIGASISKASPLGKKQITTYTYKSDLPLWLELAKSPLWGEE